MEIQGYNQGQYEKKRNSLEKYLARIIERFFVAENRYTQSSAEAIITESLTRLKRSLLTEKGFLFSFNGMTGNIVLTINSFGGEQAFAKNTAFNKDFGSEEDTVCAGDDPRLSNAREPLGHVHSIADINTLREELDACMAVPSTHYHENRDILGLITYSGAMAKIDLVFVETAAESVKQYIDIITFHRNELATYQKGIADTLTGIMSQALAQLTEAEDAIKAAGAWLANAKQYADARRGIFNTEIRRLFHNYVTNEQMAGLLCNVMHIVCDGEIPLDGEPSVMLSQVEETDEVSGDGDGDILKEIYDNGIQKGEQKWRWSDTLQSFVFQENLSVHSVFLSPGVYDDYIHRVTLGSSDADDDIISVVLAYDDTTGSMLSLMCTCGGVTADGHSGPQAAVVLDFDDSWAVTPFNNMVSSLTVDTATVPWNAISGMSVLVKRTGNTFSIWVLYNTAHSWSVSDTGDGHKDIITSTPPLFEFNMEDFPELSCFCNNSVRYGYGCYSQAMSTYSDVCFIARRYYDEWHGHTNINQQSSCSIQIPDSAAVSFNGGHAKLFFRYDTEDGGTETFPLPYVFPAEDGSMVAVQGEYTEDGKINITTNLMQKAGEYIDGSNFWDSRTIIAPNGIYGVSYSSMDFNGELCFIDSQEKNDFVCSILEDGKEYFIAGSQFEPEGTGWQANGTEMTYFNWDEGEPGSHDMTNIIYINTNKKWSSSGYYTGGKGYVAEYKLKTVSDYYSNPRIYYQVYGRME